MMIDRRKIEYGNKFLLFATMSTPGRHVWNAIVLTKNFSCNYAEMFCVDANLCNSLEIESEREVRWNRSYCTRFMGSGNRAPHQMWYLVSIPIYTCNLRALPNLGTLVLGRAPPAIHPSSMHCIMRSPQLLLLLYSCGQSFQLFHDRSTQTIIIIMCTRHGTTSSAVQCGLVDAWECHRTSLLSLGLKYFDFYWLNSHVPCRVRHANIIMVMSCCHMVDSLVQEDHKKWSRKVMRSMSGKYLLLIERVLVKSLNV